MSEVADLPKRPGQKSPRHFGTGAEGMPSKADATAGQGRGDYVPNYRLSRCSELHWYPPVRGGRP
jgi:hypothetical protein